MTDKWLTVTEAAAALGVSERTVWRRVKAGKVEIDRTHTPHTVKVSDADIDAGTPGTDELARLTDTVTDLERKVDRLATENAALDARNELLERLLDQVTEERDYLRSANAAALSKIPDQRPGFWQRLLPWRTGGGKGDD